MRQFELRRGDEVLASVWEFDSGTVVDHCLGTHTSWGVWPSWDSFLAVNTNLNADMPSGSELREVPVQVPGWAVQLEAAARKLLEVGLIGS